MPCERVATPAHAPRMTCAREGCEPDARAVAVPLGDPGQDRVGARLAKARDACTLRIECLSLFQW